MSDEVTWGSGDEPTVRLQPPADPWAGTYDRPPARPGRRAVFGRIYETIEAGQRDGEHRYIGKTEQTLHQRVHGPNGHTSPASVAKDPWKANILRGRAGYRLLETVYDTGDPAENDRALRRAEAFWIDRLRPPRNKVRPVQPPATAPRIAPPARPQRPARSASTYRERVARRKRRMAALKFFALIATMALAVALASRAVMLLHLPWTQVPVVIATVAGAYVGWNVFWFLHKHLRKLTR